MDMVENICMAFGGVVVAAVVDTRPLAVVVIVVILSHIVCFGCAAAVP